MAKLKFAFYWAASCGGCEIAVLDINEKIVDVAALADIVLWPLAVDFKYKDVEAMADGSIDVCFFNGAIRSSEHEHIAHLLRKKSKAVVAFGACACFGGIPGMANVTGRDDILDTVYNKIVSMDNPKRTLPRTSTMVKEGELTLPELYDEVFPLDKIIGVDYYLPGCPPTPALIVAAVTAIATGKLPPKGSTIAGEKAVCDECKKKRSNEKCIKKFYRPFEITPDPEKCLLEQGLICLGPATRSGCGAMCLDANFGCRGCFGPTPESKDQGAKFLSAVSSMIDSDDPAEIEKIVGGIQDPLGTFYQFTLPVSHLRRVKR